MVDSDGSLRRAVLSEIRMPRRIKLCGNLGGWFRQRAQPMQRPWGRMVCGRNGEEAHVAGAKREEVSGHLKGP